MSRVSHYSESVPHGSYKVLWDFEAKSKKQLNLQQEEIVELQDQDTDRGWVWVTNSKGETGFAPYKFLSRFAQGGWDRFAYGSEVMACLTLHLNGLFVLMYGSQLLGSKQDVFVALGAISIAFGSLCLVMIYFRDRLSPLWRGAVFVLMSAPLFITYPIGTVGGVILLQSAIAEFVKQRHNDQTYVPAKWSIENCCGFVFSEQRSCTGYFVFTLWLGLLALMFVLGYNLGHDDAEEWDNDIPKEQWAVAQATGTVLSFCFTMLLVFSLRGFQSVLLGCADSIQPTYKKSKKAVLKSYLQRTFTQDNMMAVHTVISITIIAFSIAHCFAHFAAFDKSGPGDDYYEKFGDIPVITGGIALFLLSIVISSAWIVPEQSPRVFKIVHRAAFLLVITLFFHGRDGYNSNFWKFMIAPVAFYVLDKVFRLGLLSFATQAEIDFSHDAEAEGQTFKETESPALQV